MTAPDRLVTSLGIFYVKPENGALASRRLRQAGVGAHEGRVGSARHWSDAAVFTVIDDQVQSAAEALREVRS